MKKNFLYALFLFVSVSWCACTSGSFTIYKNSGIWEKCETSDLCDAVLSNCSPVHQSSSTSYLTSLVSGGCRNSNFGDFNCPITGGIQGWCNTPDRVSCNVQNSCTYSISCSTQCEADSLVCVNTENMIWKYTGSATCGGMECVENTCDSTFNCIEYPFNRCEDVPSSGSVECDENGCSGLPYSRWYSELRTECQNECGEYRINSITGDTLISFDSSCDDTTQCSNETKCVDFPNSGTYALYKVCIVGNQQIGNGVSNRSYPQFVGGGSGNCSSLGYPSSNLPNSSNNTHNNVFPNQSDTSSISDYCLLYGVDCPPNFVDTTNYNDNNNRSPEHCICEPLDGSTFVSSIICPDGSRSTFYGSCDLWRSARSSSSAQSSSSTNPPESSSSGSENPPASSGGISGEYPDWPEYQKNQRNANEVLGSMVQSLKTLPSSIVSGIRELLNGYNYNEVDDGLSFDRQDSVLALDTIIDTVGVLHAIFNRLDSNNRIIDTIPNVSYNGCPCITFFNGNQANSFVGGHIIFKEIKFNLGDFHGFNLCIIIRAVVVAFASVVSFFIGFAIFKNISQ